MLGDVGGDGRAVVVDHTDEPSCIVRVRLDIDHHVGQPDAVGHTKRDVVVIVVGTIRRVVIGINCRRDVTGYSGHLLSFFVVRKPQSSVAPGSDRPESLSVEARSRLDSVAESGG